MSPRMGRRQSWEVGEGNRGESGVVMSVAVERQLPKESHELEREEDVEEESDVVESEDGTASTGVGGCKGFNGGGLRSMSLPLALRLSPCCHSTTWRRLSRSSARRQVLDLWVDGFGMDKPATRLASSKGSRGKSLPFMAWMTSLNETVRLWEGFLGLGGEVEGGMQVY